MRKANVYVILRNDDPCALSDVDHERRVLELFERYGVPHVAAVIPRVVSDPHDDRTADPHPLHTNPAMVDLLKTYQARGLLEIAQHGETHQTNRYRPSRHEVGDQPGYDGIAGPWLAFNPAHPEGYSEFNGLPIAEQREKIVNGKAYLEDLFGITLKTFIFPWNAYNDDCLRLLRDAGFEYVPGGDEEHRVPGMLVLGCCTWNIEDQTKLVEDALDQGIPALVHLSFHSWMLKEPDLRKLEDFLERFTRREAIAFITPSQIAEIPHHVARYVWLRWWLHRLRAAVNRHVRTIHTGDPRYYLFSVGHYLRQIYFHAIACLILKTLGLTKMLLTLSIVTVVLLFIWMRSMSPAAVLPVVSTLALVATLYLLGKTAMLRSMRCRQHQAEANG